MILKFSSSQRFSIPSKNVLNRQNRWNWKVIYRISIVLGVNIGANSTREKLIGVKCGAAHLVLKSLRQSIHNLLTLISPYRNVILDVWWEIIVAMRFAESYVFHISLLSMLGNTSSRWYKIWLKRGLLHRYMQWLTEGHWVWTATALVHDMQVHFRAAVLTSWWCCRIRACMSAMGNNLRFN